LKGTTENLNATAESLLVPGVLADLFESVGGAIYKNSGFSRKAVLKSYTLFLVHAYGYDPVAHQRQMKRIRSPDFI
jgi:dsRNA-specific ribonuclease